MAGSKVGVIGIFVQRNRGAKEFAVGEGLAVQGKAGVHGGEGWGGRGKCGDGFGDGGDSGIVLSIVGEGDGKGVEKGGAERGVRGKGIKGAAGNIDGFGRWGGRPKGRGEEPGDVVEDRRGGIGVGEGPEVTEGRDAVVVVPEKHVVLDEMAGNEGVGILWDDTGLAGKGEGGWGIAKGVGGNHGDLEEDVAEWVAGKGGG
jgi:hypothetical protein